MDHFGPMVAQMLQMVSFGSILDHIGPFREVGTIYPRLQFTPTSKLMFLSQRN